MSRYYDPEPAPDNRVRLYDYGYRDEAYYGPGYSQRPPPRRRDSSAPRTHSYDEEGYSSRRSRPDYGARSSRSYDARSSYPTNSSPASKQDEKRRWVVTALLSGLVLMAVAGIQVWTHRVSEGGGDSKHERRRRERAFDDAKRSRRRDEERREREEEEEWDEDGSRMQDRPRIEYVATRRQRARSVRRIEAPRLDDDDDGRDDDVRTVRRDYDDDSWARSRRSDR